MIRLRPYSVDDFPLLQRGNEAAMTTYIGGPESSKQVAQRHNNYLRFWTDGTARMFVIVDDDRAVGSIGWWTTQWRDAPVHETGWFVLPEFQGRGFASAAVAEIIEDAREHGTEPLLTAFPSVENPASNRLCESAGFTVRGTAEFPFRGIMLTVNEWAYDLRQGKSLDS